jgi:hypothetical protein
MKKKLINLSKDILVVSLSGGEYDGRQLQIWGGQVVEFNYDVQATVDQSREGDLRIDTYR